MNLTRPVLLVAALVQLAGAGMMDQMLVHDSLRDIEPWLRPRWLAARGLSDYYAAHSWKPAADSGLACVGRWSYGPSVKVSLRTTADDTIVCLARGSGASIIRFRSQDSLTLDLLSDINCNGIVSRAIIRDTLVFCGMYEGGTGIEAWGISDPTNPHRLSYVYLPPIMDIAVQDTFLYATGYVQDSLRIFSVADPRNPRQVGACSDSGFPMCVSGNYCYLADRGGVNIIDVSNPAAPYRIGKTGGGGIALSVAVRDTLCFFGVDNSTLQIYNVRNPASPSYLGSLSGTQPADLYLPETNDTVLYTSTFEIVNIADPSSPRRVGLVYPPGWEYGVTAVPALNYALVADHFAGLVAVDIVNPTQPSIDTTRFAADMAEDVAIDNGRAYIAGYHAGLQILDVMTPNAPTFLGSYDTVGTRPDMEAVCARDSFAYVPFYSRALFRSVCVSDPRRPTLAGVESTAYDATDMVLRDTFVYKVSRRNMQVVNVARPRQPVLVGSCVAGDATNAGICLVDTLAYVTNAPTQVINVADPTHPAVIGEFGRGAWNVRVRDTFAYLTGNDGLYIYSVADPTAPRFLDSVSVGQPVYDLALADSLAYAGCQDGVRLLSLADPAHPAVVGYLPTPYLVWGMEYAPPYVYAACSEAGVCVLETTQTGMAEGSSRMLRPLSLRALPNPTSGMLHLETDAAWSQPPSISVRDVAGRTVQNGPAEAHSARALSADIASLPAGVYFIELRTSTQRGTVKICKR